MTRTPTTGWGASPAPAQKPASKVHTGHDRVDQSSGEMTGWNTLDAEGFVEQGTLRPPLSE